MLMKYVGPSLTTIEHGEILTLISIERVRNKNPYFPSGIALGFRKDDGSYFGMSDRSDWVKVK